MMRSLYSGVSGLRSHQTKMDVIGNNISNVNTVGYKKATTTFSDAFNQTMRGASMANDNTGRGGLNSMQIGLGSSVAAVQNVMTRGSSQRTDNTTDVMINGNGFFVVRDVTGYYFTRAGAFSVDENGNLVDTNGLKVCGWNAVDDQDNPGQQKIVQTVVTPVNIYEGEKSYVPPAVTTTINFTGNLNSVDNPEQINTLSFYDSIGNRFTVEVRLTYQGDNQWQFDFARSSDGNVIASINGDVKNTVALNINGDSPTIQFENGILSQNSTRAIELSITHPDDPNVKFADTITVNFKDLTQFNAKNDATATTVDGYTAGSISGFSIGSDGIITGSYTNGLTKILGEIVIADFVNPAGLQKIGDNLFATTVNSGDFDGIGQEVGVNGANFISGSLEMSNVDLAYEFTEMITTQRGFQTNSRIITTSDEMLQELVNLKR